MKFSVIEILLFLALIAMVQCQMRRITIEDYVGNVANEPPKKSQQRATKKEKNPAAEEPKKTTQQRAEKEVPPKSSSKANSKSKTEKSTKTSASSSPSAETTSKASNPPATRAPKIIQFRNNYDDIMSLYWLNTENDKGDMKLSDIPPRTSVNTTSFVDHIFYAIMNEDDEDTTYRATPMMVSLFGF